MFFHEITNLFGFRINPQEKRLSVTIRDGTIYQESIGVRRMWTHPKRNVVFDGSAYFDIAVLELGENYLTAKIFESGQMPTP